MEKSTFGVFGVEGMMFSVFGVWDGVFFSSITGLKKVMPTLLKALVKKYVISAVVEQIIYSLRSLTFAFLFVSNPNDLLRFPLRFIGC